MVRLIFVVLIFLTTTPAVVHASARNLLETGHVQRLLTRRDERLHERLLRWQAACNRRSTRREDRLRMRGRMGLAPPASDADRSCRAIHDRFATFVTHAGASPRACRSAPPTGRDPEHPVQGKEFPDDAAASSRACRRVTEEPPKPPSPPAPRSPSPFLERVRGEVGSPPPPDLLPNQTFTPTVPLPTLDARSHLLILGHRANAVATVKVTPDNEPVGVRSVRITLIEEAGSVTAFEILDDLGYVLGTAALDLAASAARNIYTLNLSPENAYFIGKDETAILAAVPRAKEKDAGGVSGQTVQVSAIDVTAIGRWTSRTASVVKSGPDFQKHRTALAAIVAIDRDGPATGTFRTGNETKIAAFRFEARMNDDGEPALTDLTFSVSKPDAVTIGNVLIRANDSSETLSLSNGNDSHACAATAATIICNVIPSAIGSLQSPRTISLFADVSFTNHPNPFLEITINAPGTPDSAGSVTWTDGETGFSWVEFDQPVVEGTGWE